MIRLADEHRGGYITPMRLPRSVMPTVLGLCLAAASATAAPQRATCATTALRDLPDFARGTTGIGDRPVSDDGTDVFVDDDTLPLRVHHLGGGEADAALVLDELRRAWTLQVDGAGFGPPPADDSGFDNDGGSPALDVYLAPLPAGVGAVTVSGRDIDADAAHDRRPSFIVLDPAQPDDVLAAAAHHEFQHVLQFAIDARESVLWFEATAVAFEVRGRPDVTSWQDALPAFQQQPQAPITADGLQFAPFATDADLRLEYGAGLFALYLDDVHGEGDGTFLRTLWQDAAGVVVDGDVTTNSPDWLTALAAHADLPALLVDFAAWRALTPPLSVSDDGPVAYNLPAGTGVRGQRVLLERLSGTLRTTGAGEGPFVGGCQVTSASAPSTGPGTTPMFVHAESVDGHQLGAVILVVHDGAATRTDAVRGPTVDVNADVVAGAEVMVLVCDVSITDAEADPVFAPIRLALGTTPYVARARAKAKAKTSSTAAAPATNHRHRHHRRRRRQRARQRVIPGPCARASTPRAFLSASSASW